MLILKNTLLALSIIFALQTKCQAQEPQKEIIKYEFKADDEAKYILPLYGLNYVKDDFIITSVIEDYTIIKKETPLLEVAQIIAKHVSKKMKGLKLGVEIVELKGGAKCLNLELIEHDTYDDFMKQSWAQSFAASSAAIETLNIIVPNFLQKDYKGPWIDVIRFEDEGDGTTKHEYLRYERIFDTLD